MYEEKIKEAYKCGFAEGYDEAMNEIEELKMHKKAHHYMKDYKME